jgi:hypothetical protein
MKRHTETPENLRKAVTALDRAGIDTQEIKSSRIKVTTDEKFRMHTSTSCQGWRDGGNLSHRQARGLIGDKTRNITVGAIVDNRATGLCWRCSKRDLEREIGRALEKLMCVLEAENMSCVVTSADGRNGEMRRAVSIMMALDLHTKGGNQERTENAALVMKHKVIDGAERALVEAEKRASHLLLRSKHNKAKVGRADFSWMPLEPRLVIDDMYKSYCETGALTGRGSTGALRKAVDALETYGGPVTPEKWGDVVSMVRGWDTELNLVQQEIGEYRAIVSVVVQPSLLYESLGLRERTTDTSIAAVASAQKTSRRDAVGGGWLGFTHVPVGATVEMENINGATITVQGRVKSSIADELVELAANLWTLEGSEFGSNTSACARAALSAAAAVLATGLEPALEGF